MTGEAIATTAVVTAAVMAVVGIAAAAAMAVAAEDAVAPDHKNTLISAMASGLEIFRRKTIAGGAGVGD